MTDGDQHPLADRVSADGTTLVCFTGRDCPISDRLVDLLDDVSSSVPGDEPATVVVVDADIEPMAAQHFDVKVLPTFVVFVDGSVKVVRTGAVGRGNLEAMLGRGQLTPRRGMRRRR